MYQFIENLKSDKAFFFYYGRGALYALLKALGIGPGDEVLMQVFTCFHVPAPVAHLGATPVYVDIDPGTFSMDPGKIEQNITEKTRAIIVQHTFGIPAEMDAILQIARRHDLWVIEDSCQALGSKYKGQEVGTFGDAAFYSFGWHKPIVLGVGGAALVNNPVLLQLIQEQYANAVSPPVGALLALYIQTVAYELLVTPARFSSLRDMYRSRRVRSIVGRISRGGKAQFSQAGNESSAQNRKRENTASPYLRRIIPFQEDRLFRKLAKFDSLVEHQEWVVSRYQDLLSQAGYDPFQLDSRFEPIYYKYPVLSDHKTAIFDKAPQARIELSDMFVSPLYPPWHKKRWESQNYRAGLCPISEDISDRIIPLSIHSKVKAKEIERTVALLASFK